MLCVLSFASDAEVLEAAVPVPVLDVFSLESLIGGEAGLPLLSVSAVRWPSFKVYS